MPITAPAKVRISPKAVRTVGSMTPIGGTKKAAVMLNTAIATSSDVVLMAGAFGKAIKAGREAYLARFGRVLESSGEASSPLSGFLE